jgi:cell division protein FtsB
MKKLLALLAIVIAITSVSFFTAHAVNAEEFYSSEESLKASDEGENLPVSSESVTEEEIPTEDNIEATTPEEAPNNITLTKEELKDIIDAALNEQQKELVNTLAGKIATSLGIEYETVYIATGAILLVIVIVIILLAYVFKGKGSLKELNTRLKAQQGAYAVLAESKDELANILKTFSSEEIGALIQKNLKAETEKLTAEISTEIINKLKIDENTLSELLGNEKILVTQVKLLSEALIAIAANNRDAAINILSKAPTTEAVNELTLENEKLKTALG